jgi:glycolate oxidase FAD binding subunit
MKTVQPHTEREIAEVLRCANRDGLAVIPRGNGTKSDWGNPPSRADVILSTASMNRVVEHAWADLTVTVEAGCTIAALQRTLAEHGQRLAVDPLWPERATVGGVLSANDTGVLRFRYGGLRDLVIGVTLALADGTLARSGGKVVKNVAGYDLPKLVTGAFGTLGVITSATFRLHPLPKQTRTVSTAVRDLREAQKILLAILDSQLAPAAVQVRVGRGAPQIDVLFEGTEAGIDAQSAALETIAAFRENSAEVWNRLDASAKISVEPSEIAEALDSFDGYGVIQATGIGWLQGGNLAALREKAERMGGSLALMQQRNGMDAWGAAGDSLALMREIKRQFDPNNILNPGCFVGGI